MTPQQIEYLLVLEEERKFSKAAERLYISQPALSQRIQKWEKQIGMSLFDRSTSPFTLTPAGKLYIEAARNAREKQTDLDKKIADLDKMVIGKLRIGTSAFRASCMLPNSIRTFAERYPGVQIEICTDKIEALRTKLKERQIDVCIELDSFDPETCDIEELGKEFNYLAIPKEHPINDKWKDKCLTTDDMIRCNDKLDSVETVDLAEVVTEDFVYMSTDSSFYKPYLHMCLEAGVVPKMVLETEQIETAFHWANSNMVLALLPDTLIRWFGGYIQNACYYKLNLPSSNQRVVVATKKGSYVSKAVREYKELLKDSFSKII